MSSFISKLRGGTVIRFLLRSWSVFLLAPAILAQTPAADRPPIMLPTSKMLTVPSPGRIGSTNSFPATMVVSPDGRYAALLNDGYGTQETLAHQSISMLDLTATRSSSILTRASAMNRTRAISSAWRSVRMASTCTLRWGR